MVKDIKIESIVMPDHIAGATDGVRAYWLEQYVVGKLQGHTDNEAEDFASKAVEHRRKLSR